MSAGHGRDRKSVAIKSFRAGMAVIPVASDDLRSMRTNLLQGRRARITDRLLPCVVCIGPRWMRGFTKDAFLTHPTLAESATIHFPTLES